MHSQAHKKIGDIFKAKIEMDLEIWWLADLKAMVVLGRDFSDLNNLGI